MTYIPPPWQGGTSDIARVVLTEDANVAIRWLPADEAARIRRALRKLPRLGWTDALKTRLVVRLSGHIHELRVPGRGQAYRVTCFIAAEEGMKTVVIVDCVPKSRWKVRRVAAYLDRAERVRARWLESGKTGR